MTTIVGPRANKPRVALFSGPEGHLSIARAAAAALAEDYDTSLTQVRDGLFKLYTPIYQFFPSAFKVPHKLSEQQPIRKSLLAVFKRKYRPIITKKIDDFRPDLTISTHFMFAPGLERARLEANLPFINLVPDPRTLHPLLISENASQNLVFDQAAAQTAAQLMPAAQIQSIGWLVRPEFQPVRNCDHIRHKLGLAPQIFTIVISSGSEGTNAILNLIPSLWQLPKACQCVVLCGSNTNLLKTIRALNRIISRANPQVRLIPVGFTHQVHEYYQAADMVAGKAGPNTLFEANACHKPFLALTHIHGQEDGNLELIQDYGIGWVEENMFKAAKLISSLVKNPRLVHTSDRSIKAMAAINRRAGEQLRAEVLRLIQL